MLPSRLALAVAGAIGFAGLLGLRRNDVPRHGHPRRGACEDRCRERGPGLLARVHDGGRPGAVRPGDAQVGETTALDGRHLRCPRRTPTSPPWGSTSTTSGSRVERCWCWAAGTAPTRATAISSGPSVRRETRRSPRSICCRPGPRASIARCGPRRPALRPEACRQERDSPTAINSPGSGLKARHGRPTARRYSATVATKTSV